WAAGWRPRCSASSAWTARPRRLGWSTAAGVRRGRGRRRGGGLPLTRRPLVGPCPPRLPTDPAVHVPAPHGDRPVGRPAGAAPPPGRVRLLRRGARSAYPRTVHRAAGESGPRRVLGHAGRRPPLLHR